MLPENIVLYADDDLDDLQFIKESFAHYSNHIELVTVPDGIEAITYLQNIPSDSSLPCLIILDINMPRMDGKEALKTIRGMKRFEKVPVVLFTTSSQSKDREFSKMYNAGFLTKPITYTDLEVIAHTFIGHCSVETKNKLMKQMN